MVGQKVEVVGPTVGWLVSGGEGHGSELQVTNDLLIVLEEAPDIGDLEGHGAEGEEGRRVRVRIGPPGDPASFLAEIPWQAVRLRAEICLAAYLDDISAVLEAHLLRPFTLALRELGPRVGLYFDTAAKNYTYVPRMFSEALRQLLPEASGLVIVDDQTPGGAPKAQLEYGARQLRGDGRGLLVSTVGIAKLMGAPLRALCPGEGLEADRAWLVARALEQAAEVARLFAHLGLDSVDEAAVDRYGQVYLDYKASAAKLPPDEAQIQMLIARYCLGTRLNCLSRFLPASTSQLALREIDRLLAATVAGCAGFDSLAVLTRATQRRSLLAMRHGGVIPGAEIPAAAQHVSSEAAIERFIFDQGTLLRREGREPDVLRRICERISNRATNFDAQRLTPLESGLVRDVQLINEAAADPEVLELRRSSSRGGEERLRDLAALAGGDAGAANREEEVEAAGDGRVVAAPALVSIGRLSEAAGKSRAMSEGLWLREFLGAYRQGTGEERTNMVEGLSKGAGVALLAVPMVPAFTFSSVQFRLIVSKFLGLPSVQVPWTHHCERNTTRVLVSSTVNHLASCCLLGGHTARHNAVRDVLAHMTKLLGLTDASVVETPVTASDGNAMNADVVYVDNASGKRVILEVAVLSVNSDSSLGASARAGLDSVRALLMRKEAEKRNHAVIRRLINEEGNSTTFIPIVMTANGAMGPSMVAFLKESYDRAKTLERFDMRKQHAVQYSWNTLVASTYWDMRLSIASAATDAEFQSRVIRRDMTLNLPVVARQPHPDPNYAPHAAHFWLPSPAAPPDAIADGAIAGAHVVAGRGGAPSDGG